MRKNYLIIILAASLIFGLRAPLGFGASTWTPRQVFHTQKADIVFEHRAYLEELALRLGAVGSGLPPQPDLGRLAEKIDAMLTEISRILQRRLIKPVKVEIRLLRDGFQVQQQQLALRVSSPHPVIPDRRSLESYYEPRLRTIFLSLADVRLGILAHEMTHFILCESHPACPGDAFQESLARYIEDRFNAGK